MYAYRIADGRFPIYDGTGAMLHGGRWNSPGRPVIYAAETFAGAMLEVLVHANLSHIPRTHRSVRIEVPESLIERVNETDVPGWKQQELLASRAFGDRWLAEARSAALLVPGVATGGREHIVLIDPRHPQFPRIQAGASEPAAWDSRLFRR